MTGEKASGGDARFVENPKPFYGNLSGWLVVYPPVAFGLLKPAPMSEKRCSSSTLYITSFLVDYDHNGLKASTPVCGVG